MRQITPSTTYIYSEHPRQSISTISDPRKMRRLSKANVFAGDDVQIDGMLGKTWNHPVGRETTTFCKLIDRLMPPHLPACTNASRIRVYVPESLVEMYSVVLEKLSSPFPLLGCRSANKTMKKTSVCQKLQIFPRIGGFLLRYPSPQSLKLVWTGQYS